VLSLDRWTPAEQFRGGVAWPGSKPRAAIARGYESRAAEFVGRLVLAPGARVLDVPCGTGNLALPAARAGADVTGVDIDIGSSSPSVSETSPRSGRTTSSVPGELAGAGPLSRPSSHSPAELEKALADCACAGSGTGESTVREASMGGGEADAVSTTSLERRWGI
jgi:SAM-dependent methyltransferase